MASERHRQYDVVTTGDLAALGISRDTAERRVRAGRWQHPVRRVYVRHDRPLTRLVLGHVASAYVGAGCVITGLVTLHELGLRWLPPAYGIDVLVPKACRRRTSGLVRVRRCSSWDTLTTWQRAGLRWADADQAVVDAARRLPDLRDVRGVVLGAVADRHATVDGLTQVLSGGQRNGSALVRRVVGDSERGCASPPEAELVDQLVGCGEPFLVNPQIWIGDVLIGRPDIWFLRWNVGGEVESVEFHGSDDQRESTYDRHERFLAAGVPLAHLSVRRVREQPPIAGGWLLARGEALAVAPPVGLRVVPSGPTLR